ncbi:hypothetical protein E2C01_016714 [Portunus trituberculatus]|uniref:Uncharacterized protein n=1 Tax=Portunus trituberculatus TaxID=210409 RepID=A0A5B7DRX7_PORTR|nr:hypothetical protein [Portunus trituberculatus]
MISQGPHRLKMLPAAQWASKHHHAIHLKRYVDDGGCYQLWGVGEDEGGVIDILQQRPNQVDHWKGIKGVWAKPLL